MATRPNRADDLGKYLLSITFIRLVGRSVSATYQITSAY